MISENTSRYASTEWNMHNLSANVWHGLRHSSDWFSLRFNPSKHIYFWNVHLRITLTLIRSKMAINHFENAFCFKLDNGITPHRFSDHFLMVACAMITFKYFVSQSKYLANDRESGKSVNEMKNKGWRLTCMDFHEVQLQKSHSVKPVTHTHTHLPVANFSAHRSR